VKLRRRSAITLGIVGALLWSSAPSASAASATYYYQDCYVVVSNSAERARTIGTCANRQSRHQYNAGGATHWTHFIHSHDGLSPYAPTVIKSQHTYLAGGVTRTVTLGR
jgi:hypothetical protein